MKKILTVIFCLLLMAMMTLPVLAAPEVKFTSDSKFVPGGKITVDILAMTDMDSTIYEAWLEGDVVYHWYVDGVENPELSGKSITIGQEHVGHLIHVEVVCYDLTVVSQRYLIANGDVTTTAPTTAPTTVPTTEPSQEPTSESPTSSGNHTASTIASTTKPTATNTDEQGGEAPSDEPFPWLTVVLIAALALVLGIGIGYLAFKKKK